MDDFFATVEGHGHAWPTEGLGRMWAPTLLPTNGAEATSPSSSSRPEQS